MGRRWVTLAVCAGLFGALAAAPAGAATPGTVTATGTGQSRVLPADRHNNASIVAAYDAARRAAIAGAISQAHEYAAEYARAAGLTLGPVESVSDAQTNGYYGPGQFFGPFGPNRFCGTESRPIFAAGKTTGPRKIIGTRKVHRCIVPSFAYTTLAVTYAAG